MIAEPRISEAIGLFRELEARYRNPPRGRASQDRALREAFAKANVELYQLAQAIAAAAEPAAQQRLNCARRHVVEYLIAPDAQSMLFSAAKLRPKLMQRPIRWCEVMLTPELEGDLALSGSRVPYALATELREAHRAQIEIVRRTCSL